MGTGASSNSASQRVQVSEQELERLVAAYLLTREEIPLIISLFSSLDTSGHGQVPLKRIIQSPAIVLNPLAREILYKAVGYNGVSETMEEHHISQGTLMELFRIFSPSATAELKLEALFKLYDEKHQGYWTEKELYCMMSMQVGAVLTEEQLLAKVQQAMATADLLTAGQVTLSELEQILPADEVAEKLTIHLT